MAIQQQTDKKVALVTGASGGVGKEIALCLADHGIAVVVHYSKSSAVAEEVVDSIVSSGGSAYAIQADLTQPSEIHALFQSIIEKYHYIDYVVNNAGVISRSVIADITEADYAAIFDINVKGSLFVLKEAAQHLREGGRIVNMSSNLVVAPTESVALYAASKAALESFGQVLAKELGGRSITVNSIRLGPTVPGMFEQASPERQAAAIQASPFKRLGTPKDVADVVAFLVSEESRWITGQNILVNGGVG